MSRNKKLFYPYLVLTLIILLLAVIFLILRFGRDDTDKQAHDHYDRLTVEQAHSDVTVYYSTLDGRYLLPLNTTINATREVAQVALEKLLAGPPVARVSDIIPEGTKLLDLYVIEGVVYVNLTREILSIPPEQAQLALRSIACTVLESSDGLRLQLLVEGKLVEQLGEVDTSEPLAEAWINLEGDEGEGLPNIYYLQDSNSGYLVPITTFASAATLESLASKLISLQLAPQLEDLQSPYPSDCRLLGVGIENKVAYVDFSAEFAHNSDPQGEQRMLAALAHTLCRIDGINEVQVLIEGQTVQTLPGGSDLSKPLNNQTPINRIS